MNYAPSWRGQAEHRLRLIRELKRRECRRSFLAFCIEALKPLGLSPAPHHRLLINELEQIARGENDRLLINMQPGSAKSTYVSVLFPAWLLEQAKNLPVYSFSSASFLAIKRRPPHA